MKPTPTIWLDECTNFGANWVKSRQSVRHRSSWSSGIVEISRSYATDEPSSHRTRRADVSILQTRVHRFSFSYGSCEAIDVQIAPVPPRIGNRNVALGPQLTSSLRSTRFARMRARSTVATRSPIQPTPSCAGGYAHTLKLYGYMNDWHKPSPNDRFSHSAKSRGGPSAAARCVSTSPFRHRISSSLGSRQMLFWNG